MKSMFILSSLVALSCGAASVELYPIAQLRLTPQSLFRGAVKADVSYVKELDVDRLLVPARREAGLPAKAQAYGN